MESTVLILVVGLVLYGSTLNVQGIQEYCKEGQIDLGDGKCAIVVTASSANDMVSYAGAKKRCHDDYAGNLVSIHSLQQTLLLASNMTGRTAPLLIGLDNDYDKETGKGNLTWADDSKVDFEYWHDRVSHPNTSQHACTAIEGSESGTSNGDWFGQWKTYNAYDCNERTFGFICQVEVRGRNETTPPSDVCPTGWTLYQGDCYKYSATKATYSAAEATCAKTDASLVSIQSKAENAAVLNMVGDYKGPLLLGLHRESNKKWEDVITWADGSYKILNYWAYYNYSSDIPNDAHYCTWLNTDRLAGYDGTTQWISGDCDEPQPFMCKIYKTDKITPIDNNAVGDCPQQQHRQWEKLGNYCYYFSEREEKETWRNARAKCLELGATLSSVTHPEVNDFLYKKAKYISNGWITQWWIGFVRGKTDEYIWEDHSDVTYTNWALKHPFGQDYTAALNPGSNGQWNSWEVDIEHNYICSEKLAEVEDAPPDQAGPCPDTGDWKTRGHHCYLFRPDDPLTWHEAAEECKQMGGSQTVLATSDSLGVNKWLQGELDAASRLPMARLHWLGLKFDLNKKGYWQDRTVYAWNNWYKDTVLENCTAIRTLEGDWERLNCQKLRGYACQVRKGTDYSVNPTPLPNLDSNAGKAIAICVGALCMGILLIVSVFIYQRGQQAVYTEDAGVVAYNKQQADDYDGQNATFDIDITLPPANTQLDI